MTTPWILAIDLGNGGPKVARVSPEGEILATAFRSVDVHIGLDGAATQDADEWWTELIAAVREIAADGLRSVAVTGQWGSTVPVGFDGAPTGPVLLWADTRARDLVQPLISGPISVGGYAPHKALPFIRHAAGAPNTDGADPTGHSILLKTQFPEQYSRTATLLEPVDYLGLRLTGRTAATPASMTLSWLTGHKPGEPQRYLDTLIKRTRRDRAKLPDLLDTGSVLGPLLREVVEAFGVAGSDGASTDGVPVICGIPDLHAAVVGSGAVAPYASHIAISTTAWIGARVPFKRTDLFHSIATVPGLDRDFPAIANNHETGGAALQWLREQIFSGRRDAQGDVIIEGSIYDEPPGFDDMISWAESTPAGSEGLIFTPWLNGERSPVDDKLLRGAWLNLSLRSDRGAMVRSVMEGVAYNMRWLAEPYAKFLRRPLEVLRVLGGGAMSDLWCQIHADVLGVPLERVADPREAQLRGVALWARICLGEISLEEAGELVPVDRRFEPDPAVSEVYERGYREFAKLAGTLRGFYHRVNS